MKFRAFGLELLVSRENDRWRVYYPGSEGKRRPARDIVIPAGLAEAEIQGYLADLLHEQSTERYPTVERIA
mgnify:CR=1 FL=1